jgi:hypothetical protein
MPAPNVSPAFKAAAAAYLKAVGAGRTPDHAAHLAKAVYAQEKAQAA